MEQNIKQRNNSLITNKVQHGASLTWLIFTCIYRWTEPIFWAFITKGLSEVHRSRGGELSRLAQCLEMYQFFHAGGGCGRGPLLGGVGPETTVEHVRDATCRSARSRRLWLSTVLKDLEKNKGKEKKNRRWHVVWGWPRRHAADQHFSVYPTTGCLLSKIYQFFFCDYDPAALGVALANRLSTGENERTPYRHLTCSAQSDDWKKFSRVKNVETGEDCNLRAICQQGLRQQGRSLRRVDNGQQFAPLLCGGACDI